MDKVEGSYDEIISIAFRATRFWAKFGLLINNLKIQNMQKDSLTQYLHFYLNGRKALYAMLPNDERITVTGIYKHDTNWYVNYLVQDKNSTRCGESDTIMLDVVKPILRPMSDMNQEEKERWNMGVKSYQSYALRIKFFVDRYLDVFGLIKKGLAIDATIFDNQ